MHNISDTSSEAQNQPLVFTLENGCTVRTTGEHPEILGRGGEGIVYAVEVLDKAGTSLGDYALKHVLADSYAANHGTLDNERRLMHRIERTSVDQLQHPGIPRLLAYIPGNDGEAYALMERLPGRPLREQIDAGLTLQTIIDITDQLLRTLSLLETDEVVVGDVGKETGTIGPIVHQDIKPSNIIYDPDTNQAWLLDFGLALGVNDPDPNPGYAQGTHIWISPEQFEGLKDDPRSNLFQLGLVILEMLTRGGYTNARFHSTAIPIEQARETVLGTYRQVLAGVFVDHPYIPDALRGIIMKATELRPDDRYQTARDMQKALHDAGFLPTPIKKPALSQEEAMNAILPGSFLVDRISPLPDWLEAGG